MRILPLFATFLISANLMVAHANSTTKNIDKGCPSLPTTCTWNNGKPCPKWLHEMIGQYLPPAPRKKLAHKPASRVCPHTSDSTDLWYVMRLSSKQRRAIAVKLGILRAENSKVPDPVADLSEEQVRTLMRLTVADSLLRKCSIR